MNTNPTAAVDAATLTLRLVTSDRSVMNTTSNVVETHTIDFTIVAESVVRHAAAACPSLRGSDAAQ